MNPSIFDRISIRLAERRFSRRQALAAGGAGIAALSAPGLGSAATQGATPEPDDSPAYGKIPYLFIQSYQAGSIAPSEDREGRYTVTLEHGTGQTIYFADRPLRDVGTAPTPQLLTTLGFSAGDPPNAALIVETEPGESDVAVVELFNPNYDVETRRVTYDVEVLETWRNDLELGLQEDPTDLAALAPSFGSAHLFIDDCPQVTVYCAREIPGSHYEIVGGFGHVDTCYNWIWCMPCEPYYHVQPDTCATQHHWDAKCNFAFTACQDMCRATPDNYLISPCAG